MILRVLFFISFSTIIISCREIILVEEEQIIPDYQINGLVTSASGSPIESVKVYLYYVILKISSTPLDTFDLYISDPNINVLVSVYNMSNEFVVNLFSGKLPVGPVNRFNWDGMVDSTTFAPSGCYNIRIYFNNRLVKEYPIIVDGKLTAITNKKGEFFIYSKNLPIGKVFDRYDYQNKYLGTYQISKSVLLIINYLNYNLRFVLDLEYKKITKINISI